MNPDPNDVDQDDDDDGDDCSECGGSLADGEGWDGLCGDCADRAENDDDDDDDDDTDTANLIVDTITAPACWACGLVNGDTSGLDEGDVLALRAWEDGLAAEGWRVVDVVRDADGGGQYPRFSAWSPRWGAGAGDVLDYVIHKDGTP